MKKYELLQEARRLMLQNIELRHELMLKTGQASGESVELYLMKQKQARGPKAKAARNVEIAAFAKEQFMLYRELDMSKADARRKAMVEVGDEFKNKKGQPVTRGRTWISNNLKD
jgi:hypothetical protein